MSSLNLSPMPGWLAESAAIGQGYTPIFTTAAAQRAGRTDTRTLTFASGGSVTLSVTFDAAGNPSGCSSSTAQASLTAAQQREVNAALAVMGFSVNNAAV